MAKILDAQLVRGNPLLPELEQRATWDAWVTYRPYPYADLNNCRATVFRDGPKIVVILTEIESPYRNPLSNEVAGVATALIQHPVFWDVMKPENIIWIEHHPANPQINAEETWDRVDFTWDWHGYGESVVWEATEPAWVPLSREDVLRLIQN